MESFETVHEKQLQVMCSSGVVQHLRLLSVERDGKFGYELWVKCSKNASEILMITHGRKEARIWMNLDRAVTHFREVYRYKGKIFLEI